MRMRVPPQQGAHEMRRDSKGATTMSSPEQFLVVWEDGSLNQLSEMKDVDDTALLIRFHGGVFQVLWDDAWEDVENFVKPSTDDPLKG